MQPQMSFDPHVYFGIVAENLLKNFGLKALEYADKALSKMKALGDDEGFDMWLNIHEHLAVITAETLRPEGAVFH